MYGFECEKKTKKGICRHRRCVFPEVCPALPLTHEPQIRLLDELRKLPGVRKIFIRSGIRYDLLNADKAHGKTYLKRLVSHHVSGQLKVAPEHIDSTILKFMGKPDNVQLSEFKKEFDRLTLQCGKRQFLTYYFIAAHPGCTLKHMDALKAYTRTHLKLTPEQVQIFTPTPSTFSTLMYCTGLDPFTRKRIFVEKDLKKKERQKCILTEKHSPSLKPPPKARRKRT
jgi:uncharacterized radical SAM protein YgiQ